MTRSMRVLLCGFYFEVAHQLREWTGHSQCGYDTLIVKKRENEGATHSQGIRVRVDQSQATVFSGVISTNEVSR